MNAVNAVNAVNAMAMTVAIASGAGCSQPSYVYDSHPTTLQASGDGALFFRAAPEGAAQSFALVDTATPVSFWHADTPPHPARINPHDLTLFDAVAPHPARVILNRVGAAEATLDASAAPGPVVAVLGGDLLKQFVLSFDGGTPSVSLWSNQPATNGFLSTAGFAVLNLETYGGGQIDALGQPDTFGQRAPHQFPATRLVLRACAAPAAFTHMDALPDRCCAGDERRLATGADLALVVGTGFGPLVLSESAFARVAGAAAVSSTDTVLIRHPLLRQPLAARRARLDRIALVNREASATDNLGPCVELGHARRLELVAISQSKNSQSAACAQPCDQDPRARPNALNSAGYLEIGDGVDVAIVPDTTPLLQGLRAEIRPEGPEIDGILGAGALKSARFEIDYRSQPARLIVSCQPNSSLPACRAVGRCPRLPGPGNTRICFGLTALHGLPRVCDNIGPACQ